MAIAAQERRSTADVLRTLQSAPAHFGVLTLSEAILEATRLGLL